MRLAKIPALCGSCGSERIALMDDCPTCENQYHKWDCDGCNRPLTPYGGGYSCSWCGKLYLYTSISKTILRQQEPEERNPDVFLIDGIQLGNCQGVT